MRKGKQGWTSCLRVRWALVKLERGFDGMVRTMASVHPAIVLERHARQQTALFQSRAKAKAISSRPQAHMDRLDMAASPFLANADLSLFLGK